MTASTGWSLQRGIYQALANSSELGALLGGTRIYDDAPQAASFPSRHEFSEARPDPDGDT